MRILIVVDVYPPEISSAAHLMQELAEGFLKIQGNEVFIVTSKPRHYLIEKSNLQNIPEFTEEKGVKVIRVKTLPHHKVNFLIRGVSQLLLPFLFFFKVKKYIKGNLDAVIVYSPPLPLAILGAKVKKHYRAKFILNLQDIFPQNAIDLGILKNKPLIWFFEKLEKFIYKKADKITFHSEGGRKFLIEKRSVSPEKIITLQNWIDLQPYQNPKSVVSFRDKFNLKDKFIILFAGILGPSQGLDLILQVAKKAADLPNLVFLIVGDGSEKERLEKEAKTMNLRNVVFKPLVSKDEYPKLVEESDVGLICISPKNKTPFVPGKLSGLLAAGRPVLAFLNAESDGFSVIAKANCGYAARSDDLPEAVALVEKIYHNESLKEIGANSQKYAIQNLSVEIAVTKLENIIRS